MGRNRKKGSKVDKSKQKAENPVFLLMREFDNLKQEIHLIKQQRSHTTQFHPENMSMYNQTDLFKNKESSQENKMIDKEYKAEKLSKYEKQILKGFEMPTIYSQDKINKGILKVYESIRESEKESSFKALCQLAEIFQDVLQNYGQIPENPEFTHSSTVLKGSHLNNYLFSHPPKGKSIKQNRAITNKFNQYRILEQKFQVLEYEYQNSKQIYQNLKEERLQVDHKCRQYEKTIIRLEKERALLEEGITHHRKMHQKSVDEYNQLKNMYRDLLLDYKQLKKKYKPQIFDYSITKNKS